MVVTRRVPSPHSVRHLLQVASASANVVGKSCTSSMDGARPRACVSAARACWKLQHCCGRLVGLQTIPSQPVATGRRPEAIAAEFFVCNPTDRPETAHSTLKPLKPPHVQLSVQLLAARPRAARAHSCVHNEVLPRPECGNHLVPRPSNVHGPSHVGARRAACVRRADCGVWVCSDVCATPRARALSVLRNQHDSGCWWCLLLRDSRLAGAWRRASACSPRVPFRGAASQCAA